MQDFLKKISKKDNVIKHLYTEDPIDYIKNHFDNNVTILKIYEYNMKNEYRLNFHVEDEIVRSVWLKLKKTNKGFSYRILDDLTA